jgi:enoyl-CoA hydratase
VLDGLMRNTPDALRWIDVAEREGVSAVARERDRLFADYSVAPADEQPNPEHVIEP